MDSLEDQLKAWKTEQHRVASQVVVKDDFYDFIETSKGVRFKVLPEVVESGFLYGGVDVSFPENESDQSVATYVILEGTTQKVVYQDYLYFHLTVPYVSSFLSFREIGPLESLVKKQLKDKPHFTPCVILVDGNGVLHARRAGIACFLGVRTGIPTIGVAKTLYCEDGLLKELVRSGIDSTLLELKKQRSSNFLHTLLEEKGRSMLVDKSNISPNYTRITLSVDRDTIMEDLAPLYKGIGVKLEGASGQVLGAALLGHGGAIGVKRRIKSGTKNPIYISVGHNISLDEAVAVCGVLSQARIPEPVRQADLWGRELLRQNGGELI